MQRLKQREPVARELTPVEQERERIYAEYEKAHPKPMPEITDSDDPRFYMDGDEMKEFDRKKLAADEGMTAQDHRKEELGRLYAKHSPPPEPVEEPNPFDDRHPSQQGVEKFLEAHPEYRKKENWQALAKEAEKSFHDDLILLRRRAYESESSADVERWLARTAEILPGVKAERAKKAAFEEIVKQRMANRGL